MTLWQFLHLFKTYGTEMLNIGNLPKRNNESGTFPVYHSKTLWFWAFFWTIESSVRGQQEVMFLGISSSIPILSRVHRVFGPISFSLYKSCQFSSHKPIDTSSNGQIEGERKGMDTKTTQWCHSVWFSSKITTIYNSDEQTKIIKVTDEPILECY